MSDSIRNDDLSVDARLDALLGRALGRGSVPRQQRQRHLERLGLAPRLGGSAGAWRAPAVAGRPPSSSTPVPESLPTRRRRRQWLELGAAVLAVVLVASLLVALFRDWSGGEDDQQFADSPEATSLAATATPRETREQLYVVSHSVSQNQDPLIPQGRVSALDAETGEEIWSVKAGPRIDSVLSPDGQRLFVADSGLDGDSLFALDTQTGRELWREPIENRLWNKPGTGYSTLNVSADGGTVSVYACEGCTGEFRSSDGRNWLARFDAVTGNRQPDLEIPACRGQTFLAPENSDIRLLYIICDSGAEGRGGKLEIIDPANGQGVDLTYDARLDGGFPETIGVTASAVSPGGRLLYLVSGNRLTVVDMTRQSATRVQLDEDIFVAPRLPLLTLSPDGTRMFVGSLDLDALNVSRAEVNRVDVYDTATWEPLGQMAMSYPLNGTAFTAAPDDDAVYGTFVFYPGTDDNVVESTILRHTLDGEPVTVTTRQNEEVLFLFAGTVEVDSDATPLPTPTPEPSAQERLFAASHFTGPNGDETGRVTAYDAETGALVYRIDTGYNPDAVLSPDGTRLYVVANNEDGSGDILTSYAALSGDKNWSVSIVNRVQWMRGKGPTTLAVSRDGSRLFVYSATGPGDYTIQVFDTADGRLGRIIQGVAGCTAQLFPSADGRSLYVVCLAEAAAPQVIDLEAWTSAGVMQGFGGVISGAAMTADGRHLYITHDIDTELRLTVIDMNGRAIADQRDIVHLSRDPLHELNLTALSPDGSRLFVGIGMDPGETISGEPAAREVWVWDTAKLYAGSIRSMVASMAPINGWSLAAGADNRSVFAIRDDSIFRLSYNDLDASAEVFASRPDSEFLRLFTGRVTDAPQPPSTDEPERNLRDLEIPDDLPLGLTFSHTVWTGATSAQFIFTGDENLAIQIAVRPWTDGDVLDPPDGSTAVQLGDITVYITPDPDGGWPRLAAWQDPRWTYHLSVLGSPPDGWTQDELLALVTAFSSPANAGVCPATSWVGPDNRGFDILPEAYWIESDDFALGQVDGRLVEGANEITWFAGPMRKIVDPAPDFGVSLRGTRIGEDGGQSVPLQQRDQTFENQPVTADGAFWHFRSTVIFPTYGCWQIEAQIDDASFQAVVNVEPDSSVRNPALIWGTLRWRPLSALPSESSPPCPRSIPEQIISDFGPVVGDTQANAGPAFMNGVDEDGVMRIPSGPMEAGGYYARVMFVTGGDYSGPMLVRASPGGGAIGFSLFGPDPNPMSELRLEGPGGTSPTAGVRHWIAYLRLTGPGCHALQIDGLDFTSTIAFEVVADEALNEPALPTWDGSLYALSGNDGSSGVVELDSQTGEVLRQIDLIPYSNSYPHLVVAPDADRLAVWAYLPGEEPTPDVLIYRLSDFTLLQRVPVPRLIRAFAAGDGIALSPDGRFLYAYQYETPPDGNGNNARYWLGTYDLEAQTWLADVELPGCGVPLALEVRVSPYIYVQCSQGRLLNVETATGEVTQIDGNEQTASFQHFGNKVLLLTTGGAFYSGAYWPGNDAQAPERFDLPDGRLVASLPFAVSGGYDVAYVPLRSADSGEATEIAVIDLGTAAITRTIRTSAPFSEVVFAGDGQFAYVTLTDANDFTTGIVRIDLATGAETLLAEGFFGNLVAVAGTDF